MDSCLLVPDKKAISFNLRNYANCTNNLLENSCWLAHDESRLMLAMGRSKIVWIFVETSYEIWTPLLNMMVLRIFTHDTCYGEQTLELEVHCLVPMLMRICAKFTHSEKALGY